MLPIGMFDSPFVRRVAVSLERLEIAFEHANGPVGKDFDRIRHFNPWGGCRRSCSTVEKR